MKINQVRKSGVNRLRKAKRCDYDSIATKKVVMETNREFVNRINFNFPNEDTLIRRDVHNIIRAMLQDGKLKTDILDVLNKKYANSSIKKYFEKYIEDHERKIINSKEDEGR